MIPVYRIQAEFKLAYNKVDSNHKKDYPPAFIDDIANRAIREIVEYTYRKFETTQQKIDMLQTLVKVEEYTNPTSTTELGFFKYGLALPANYIHYLRANSVNSCNKLVSLEISQIDDLNTILCNPYKKPRDKYNRIVGQIADSKINIYSESALTNLTLTYLKAPEKVFFGSYDTLEYLNGDLTAPNKNTTPVHSDIPEHYLDSIIDLMVQNVSASQGDSNQFNLRANKTAQIIQ